jgi:hypothetical protein
MCTCEPPRAVQVLNLHGAFFNILIVRRIPSPDVHGETKEIEREGERERETEIERERERER